MNKRIALIVFSLVMFTAGMTSAVFSEPVGELPLMVQAGFYTPSFQCFYLKGTDELEATFTPNEWHNYALDISKKTITYDGMSGKHKKLSLIRLKSNTKKSSVPLVIYVDNVVVKDPDGNIIFSRDFEDGDAGGLYVSQGKPTEDNATVVEKDGKKCLMLSIKSQNLYGYNGVEVQWNLPKNEKSKDKWWDFSSGKYSVSYDYYIAVKE